MSEEKISQIAAFEKISSFNCFKHRNHVTMSQFTMPRPIKTYFNCVFDRNVARCSTFNSSGIRDALEYGILASCDQML